MVNTIRFLAAVFCALAWQSAYCQLYELKGPDGIKRLPDKDLPPDEIQGNTEYWRQKIPELRGYIARERAEIAEDVRLGRQPSNYNLQNIEEYSRRIVDAQENLNLWLSAKTSGESSGEKTQQPSTKTSEVTSQPQPKKTERETGVDNTGKESERKAKADKDARDLADKALKSSDGLLRDDDGTTDVLEFLAGEYVSGKILEGALGKFLGRNVGLLLSALTPEVPGSNDTFIPWTPDAVPKVSAEERAIIEQILQDRSQVSPANPGDRGGLLEQDLKQSKPILIP